MTTDWDTQPFRRSKVLTFVTLLFFGAVACESAQSSTMDKTGSETHWLVECESDSECGPLSCLCGVCSRECSTDSECGGGTSCIEAGTSAHAAACSGSTLDPSAMCLEPCTDCDAPTACEGSGCVPAALDDDATPDDDADDDANAVADDDVVDAADDDLEPDVMGPSTGPTAGNGGEPSVEPAMGPGGAGGGAGETSSEPTSGGSGGVGSVEPEPVEPEPVGPEPVEPEPIDADCETADPVSPDPSCAATVFEDAGDACVGGSWAWDGVECSFRSHQGCASGECDRLYPDHGSCEAAHVQCLPNGCANQDAVTNGTMCGTVDGYSYRDGVCEEILCGCMGDDCEDIEPTLEECESRWAPCLARVPMCRQERFPLDNTDPGYSPDYPDFSFSVEGYESLYDEESATVAVFADWTAATWLALEDLGGERDTCPFIERFPTSDCPYPLQLSLDVDGETVRMNISLPWNALLAGRAEASEVEVRIVAHPTATMVLQIREFSTLEPVLMVVSSRAGSSPSAGASAEESVWEFPPYTFSAGDAFCRTEVDLCGWTFSGFRLTITAEESVWTVDPFRNLYMGVDGLYNVVHGYIFEQFIPEGIGCAAEYTPRQTFALVRAE